MVRRARFLFIAAFTLLSAATLRAGIPDYQPGDRANEDVVAPARMVVVDADATGKLKDREAQRVPVIYRFDPRASDETVAAFRSTFAATRSNFLAALELKFNQRRLAAPEITTAGFQDFVNGFQKQNLLFPVSAELAALWAAGESDESVEAALASRLRDAMRSFVRSDVSPPDIWVGSTLRLVSPAEGETLTARLVEERGTSLGKTNFVSLPRAKTDLQNLFSPEERAAGRFLSSFVKPNCLMETNLTRQLRAQRTEALVAADHYEAGQVIVRRGQVIDKKILAALNQLKEKTAVNQVQQLVASDQARAAADSQLVRWLTAALAGVVVLFLLGVWLARRQAAAVSLLPMRLDPGADHPAGAGAEGSWQQRALQAETRARQAQAAARSGLLAQLARWLSGRMTQSLISQRKQLLDAHQSAAVEIAEMEARLEKVHAPLQERLRAYERRIEELEKELLVKGEENRELIKAKIQIARQQLEIERGKNRLEYN